MTGGIGYAIIWKNAFWRMGKEAEDVMSFISLLSDLLKRRDVQKILLRTSIISVCLTALSMILRIYPCFLFLLFCSQSDHSMNYLLALILMVLDIFLFYEVLSLIIAGIYLRSKKNNPPPP